MPEDCRMWMQAEMFDKMLIQIHLHMLIQTKYTKAYNYKNFISPGEYFTQGYK